MGAPWELLRVYRCLDILPEKNFPVRLPNNNISSPQYLVPKYRYDYSQYIAHIPYSLLEGCDRSTAIGICRDQSTYSQLWIASVSPWISLDHLFLARLQVSPGAVLAHRAKTLSCSCTSSQPSPRIPQLPWHWPSAPSCQGSLLIWENSAASEIQTISDDCAHLFTRCSFPFVLPQSWRETPARSTEGERLVLCNSMFEGGHLPLPKAFWGPSLKLERKEVYFW